MSVTRDRRNGTWYVQAWYKTYDGKRAHKVKRGFKTKPEALAWERDFYVVQAGDTVESICQRFGIGEGEFLRLNGCSYVYPTQRVCVEPRGR